MTNKYAIYCDSLEDEQLLKDWIKKESDLEGYNDYNYRKLYFHFPANDYLGFQQNFHLYDVCLAKDGYIKINIKDFLKEYYMKELTELPKSWAVKCDGSQLFKDTVIKYLDNNSGGHFKGHKDAYYGITFRGKVDCYYHGIDQYFDTILTLEQFIKLTTKNMKTELLGLPIIKGEKHHLEAFVKDIAALGYKPSISCIKEYTLLQHNCHGSDIFLSNKDIFRDIYMGSNVNHSTIFPTKEFQLPQDWSKALDFMKENMDRWLKIQEENKEPEFKVGDIVVARNPGLAKGRTGRIESIIPGNHPYNINFGSNLIVWCQIERLATPQEIEEYNNKPKIFKMTSTSGNFELEVSKKGIYYRPEDKYLNVNDIEQMCLGFRINNGNLNDTNRDCYIITYETVKVGCKAGIPIKSWKDVFEYYKSLQ